jgi:uncharacterized protein with FMN-binding domain
MPEPGKKLANSLVAMSSAAILAVYAAGYTRTRTAARRLAAQAAARVLPPVEIVKPVAPATAPAAAVTPKPTHARVSTAAPAKMPSAPPAPIDLPEPPPAAPAIAETLPAAPAPAPIAAPEPPPTPPAPKWKDGTYLGWGSSRHGDIQAAVTIENGRIASATIAQCLTRYSCSVISNLPPEVPQRQSADVDYVSGATQSANAFYYAVVDALGKAK